MEFQEISGSGPRDNELGLEILGFNWQEMPPLQKRSALLDSIIEGRPHFLSPSLLSVTSPGWASVAASASFLSSAASLADSAFSREITEM